MCQRTQADRPQQPDRFRWGRRNLQLRESLNQTAEKQGWKVAYPRLEFCTDNGAMIAFAGAMRMKHVQAGDHAFTIKARWDLAELTVPE